MQRGSILDLNTASTRFQRNAQPGDMDAQRSEQLEWEQVKARIRLRNNAEAEPPHDMIRSKILSPPNYRSLSMKIYPCQFIDCQEMFQTQTSLRSHQVLNHKHQRISETTGIEEGYIESPRRVRLFNNSLSASKAPYQCARCGERYKHLKLLNFHHESALDCSLYTKKFKEILLSRGSDSNIPTTQASIIQPIDDGAPPPPVLTQKIEADNPMADFYGPILPTALELWSLTTSDMTSATSFETARSSLASYKTAPLISSKRMKSMRTKGQKLYPMGYSSPKSEELGLLAQFATVLEAIISEVVPYQYPFTLGTSSSSEAINDLKSSLLLKLINHHKSISADSHGLQFDKLIEEVISDVAGIGLFDIRDQPTQVRVKQKLFCQLFRYFPRLIQHSDDPVPGQIFSSEWLNFLDARGILLDPREALDWSGKGQHVEYQRNDEDSIPLKLDKVLGHSQTAIVDSVTCRRIRLARKKITCTRHLRKEDAIIEVEHLQRLQHSHIVRVVGTYTLGKDLAILLYPAAQWDLEKFMDDLLDNESFVNRKAAYADVWSDHPGVRALSTFISCLSNALDFIHQQNVKHMDIKPKNLLVRQTRSQGYKIYVADFGIARAYKSAADSETDSPISFTRAYAAPEVIVQDKRGLSADIFSLGCVFVEIMATVSSSLVEARDERQGLMELRKSGDPSFHANIDVILRWYKEIATGPWTWPLGLTERIIWTIPEMLEENPHLRARASEMKEITASLCCSSCNDGPEPFEAADAV